MAPTSVVLSQTLKSITVTKIRELQKQQKSYSIRKKRILESASSHTDVRKRAVDIYDHLVELGLWNDPEFHNVKRWVDQSRFDPSVARDKLVQCEESLVHRLDAESRKLYLANLYSRLLSEWTTQDAVSQEGVNTPEGSVDDVDAFEMVQDAQRQRLDGLREKFAKVVFAPFETDEVEIDLYLEALFEGDKGEKALSRLRSEIERSVQRLSNLTISRQELLWTIKALQKNDLLNDEKKAILQDFLQDEDVLNEIKDVLNMRLSEIDDWSWDLGEDGLPVMPRQSLNGKWRVMVDEDVMHALLTHYVGTKWAVRIKDTFKSVVTYMGIWKRASHESEEERLKRTFFSPNNDHAYYAEGTESCRLDTYRRDFLLAPLPTKFFEESGGYDDDDTGTGKKSGKEIKQLLLRTLATEVLLRQAFDGEVAVVQSDFQWFATGIPHSTIFATLRFIGFPDQATQFVRKVLEPPLDMLDGGPVRTRKRGLPMAHVFEKLFGEVVLFFMDVAVNKAAHQTLYRFHDDLWLVGKPAQCAQAWTTMEQFSRIMGLEFNFSKTGSVYLTHSTGGKDQNIIDALPKGPVVMDFLVLDPDSGDWVINQDHVMKHVKQLQKQLSEAKNVLDWIKTWNSCIGRFFSYTFGEPAQCFGRPHLNAILETHERIQQVLFDGENGNGHDVSSHLKQMISSRLSVPIDSIPDAFLYLPDTLGGLGLKNPFIGLCLARKGLDPLPTQKLQDYLKYEREGYEENKKRFAEFTERERRKRWKKIIEPDDDEASEPVLSWSDAQEYPTYEELTKHREVHSTTLFKLYKHFMSTPSKDDISMTKTVKNELDILKSQLMSSDSTDGSAIQNLEGDKELLWLLEYYCDDLKKDFGAFRCVQKDLLPLGVLGAMRRKKVTWQMVL